MFKENTNYLQYNVFVVETYLPMTIRLSLTLIYSFDLQRIRHIQLMFKACLYSLIFLSFLSFAQPHDLTFMIIVPDSTDKVYLIGNDKRLGNWNHSEAVKLDLVNDTLFTTTVNLPNRKNIEFKFTRGNWEKEALDENLSVPQNHFIRIGKQDTVYYTIHSWRDWRSFPMDQVTGSLIIHENVFSRG